MSSPSSTREGRLQHYAASVAFRDGLGSSNAANRACRAGRLLVNGSSSSGARLVAAGDVLSLTLGEERRTAIPSGAGGATWLSARETALRALADERRHSPPLAVLYEDDALAVVLKPAGLHTLSWRGTLRRGALALDDVLPLALSPPAVATDPLPAPLPRHRLDARVAGPVVVSKTRRAHVALGRSFEEGLVDKEYRALLVGRPNSPIDGPARFVVDSPIDGAAALTEVTVLGSTPCAIDGVVTDVCLKPLTGRRHQLRRHCAEVLEAPILGDDLHSAGKPVRRGVGLFLYCRKVGVAHPTSQDGARVEVEVDEPRRFERHRAKARKGWAWAQAQASAESG